MCRLEFWRVAYLATRINKGKSEEKKRIRSHGCSTGCHCIVDDVDFGGTSVQASANNSSCFGCLPEQSKRHPLAANEVRLLETEPPRIC